MLCVLDVDDVKFVINFDYPNCSEDYVHRIGRTGRSQRTGTAYTFFTPNNSKQAQDLVNVLTEANQVVNPKLYELASSNRGGGGNYRCQILVSFLILMYLLCSQVVPDGEAGEAMVAVEDTEVETEDMVADSLTTLVDKLDCAFG